MLLIDVLGWLGAASLLSAYAAVSASRLKPNGVVFQCLNLIGAGLLLANSAYHDALPSVAVNAVWIVIGLVALWRWKMRTNAE